jgi:hypothetical protein
VHPRGITPQPVVFTLRHSPLARLHVGHERCVRWQGFFIVPMKLTQARVWHLTDGWPTCALCGEALPLERLPPDDQSDRCA